MQNVVNAIWLNLNLRIWHHSAYYLHVLRLLLVLALLIPAHATVSEDASIANKLKAKLSHSKLRSDSLQYKVHDGIVEWSGTVQIPQRKGAATRMAKSAGARSVVNRIIVNSAAKPATPKAAPRQVTVRIPPH